MAYNTNGAYEAPRRQYYAQQQAPVQNGYGGHYQDQYDRNGQQYYGQAYDAGYDQSQGPYMQDMRQGPPPQSPEYYDHYQVGGHPPNGYAPAPQPQQERHYDPRYRQRPEQGRQHGYEQHAGQRPPKQSPPRQQAAIRPKPSQGRMYAPEPPQQQQQQKAIRPKQSQGRMYAPEPQQQQQTYDQQSKPTREQRPRPPPVVNGRPQTAPQPEQPPEAAKMTMEQWKAKEKARMHQEALSPQTVAWDNAFPVFPTLHSKSRPGTANGSTEEAGRASTDVQYDERPAIARDDSQSNRSEPTEIQQRGLERPALDHKPVSFDTTQNLPKAAHASPPTHQRPQLHRQDSNMAPIPVEQSAYRQQQVQVQRHPQPNMQPTERSRQPQMNGHDRSYQGDASRMYEQANINAGHPRQHQPRPPMQPIDTRHVQQQQPAFLDHGPLSPAVVPPRSASAHGARAGPGQPLMSPTSAYSQATPQDPYGMSMQQNQPGYAQTPTYDSQRGMYNDHRVPPPVTAAPMSRADQIESEMPDFDSAAHGGTSLLHKRSQITRRPIDTHAQTDIAELPSPTPPPNHLQRPGEYPMPTQHERFYDQQQDARSRSLPETQSPPQKYSGIPNGHVYEVAGDHGYQQRYDERYQQPHPPNGHPPQHYAQRPQPPYARENVPRKSMDDARPMPHRQGPPPNMQRLPTNARHPPGQYPPQQRPPGDRSVSGPAAPFDPMSERAGSAPPRQAVQGPPGRGAAGPPMGAPLAQQRSHPEQHGQRHNSNPDSLPHHPAPVRPGLMEGGPGSAANGKPPSVRNYNNGQPAQHQRQASIETSSQPITHAELDRLRAYVSANPHNQKQALILAKKLVEAATVLASEGGRADARTTAKNRERYIMDAHKMVKKLVSAGYPEAQFYLADCHGSGDLGLEVDPREAFKLYQAAAKAGHGEAAYRTAMCCEMGPEDGGGTSKDYAKAVQWYRRAAALGDPSGMFKVGVIALKGLLGQPRNVGEAVSWLNRSLQSGGQNPHAMHELGLLYESTNTSPDVRNKVVPDDGYALELFQKASALGHKFSQFRLGQAYEYGQLGLAIDNRASISWYSKAAAQGEHQAELALSGWYLTGAEGILEHSDMEAYLWARKAASSEPPLAKAMFAMGYFTEQGIGCPPSLDEAKKWYGRAASHNFPKARERLEELRRNGGRSSKQPANGKLTRNQKKDESECAVM
ncbi:uncharacterized protein LTR77_000190 [Saxophila tyrrhenica]|uniref:HCP-like protein n=1 Tax=Saxophila tyrrhenica TaxID=1690608 RepID=A0AAV9PP33_9PEZI|nr:hypothetical protein LTR77_000190 [Saxophila tyrrhenica]